MWRAFVIVVCLAGVCFAADDENVVPEMELRDQIASHTRQLLRDRKFPELEALAEDYRSNKTRLPSGFWKLANFYAGLESPGQGASGANWESHLRLLEEWQSSSPQSPTPLTGLAAAYVAYAWQGRGTGYARDVSEDGWRLFRERLGKAEEMIQKARTNSLYDPNLAVSELTVAKGLNWSTEKYERTFNEAVSKEPCYPYYYLARAGYLLPRWYGEPGDVERFASQAIKLNEACEGKGIYSRIAVYLLSYKGRDEWFFDVYKLSWPKVQEGFRDLEQRYPHSDWNLNEYCLLACHAKDSKTADELFKRIGDHWDTSVWQTEATFHKWQQWAAHPTPIPDRHADAISRWKQWLRDLMAW